MVSIVNENKQIERGIPSHFLLIFSDSKNQVKNFTIKDAIKIFHDYQYYNLILFNLFKFMIYYLIQKNAGI